MILYQLQTLHHNLEETERNCYYETIVHTIENYKKELVGTSRSQYVNMIISSVYIITTFHQPFDLKTNFGRLTTKQPDSIDINH